MALISITAPSSAEEGERVSVYVSVTNNRTIGYIFKIEISALPDVYPHYRIYYAEDIIFGGSAKGYRALFTMPDCNTTIFVNVERWENDRWNYEGVKSKIVSLEIPAPETFHLSILVPAWAVGGYVDPGSGDYLAYSTVKLTAHPLSGYQFTSWGRDASGTSPIYNLYMNSDKNVEAYFEKVPVPEYRGTITKKE
ncbi:unnamed protein product, partial [marine sediment metagenome]